VIQLQSPGASHWDIRARSIGLGTALRGMHSPPLLHTTPQQSSASAPTTLTFSMFGVRVEVRIDDASLVDRILECLPPGCAHQSSDRIDRTYEFLNTAPGWSAPQDGAAGIPCWYLLADRSLVCHTDNAAALCERFQADLELFLAVRARTHVVVHAGVVGWHGRAIVIPGRSCSGKTTLVEALIREGAEYYSDEYAVIDPGGLVSPFPQPLAIRERADSRRTCTAEELGGVTGRQPIPIGSIVVTEYQPGASWQPRQLSPGEAVLALLSNSPAARYQPGFLLKTLRVAVRGVVGLSGVRGEANEFAKWLLEDRGRKTAPLPDCGEDI